MDENRTPELDRFVSIIQFDELCVVATNCRGGISCRLGHHTLGDFNIIYELVFSDNVVWMARIPLPYNCFQPEEVSASYAATLKYLKRHSSIPVPEVFHYQLESDPRNKVNVTYILMERRPGHPLPVLEHEDCEPDPKDLALAKKVHVQLTDVILQLASLTFDKIGSLREDSNGNFFVGPYIDSMATAYPKHKGAVYNGLDSCNKGPFTSVSDWYRAMALLNRKFALEDPEEDEEDRAATVGNYELLAEFADKIVIEEFDHGPFVINHNDLTVQNILVDDEFNITGILDFPGTIVPLPSLCVFPWMFSDNLAGLVVERDVYLDTFLNRECHYLSSTLQSRELRRKLMGSAYNRQKFELGLLGPYTPLVLPMLFEKIYDRSFDSDVEYKRLAETRPWFKRLVEGRGGSGC